MVVSTFVNMSDNDDLLGDDLGDHSLNDYNLGNEEEEQLLADDYENANTQNVPLSGPYIDNGVVPTQYTGHQTDYGNQQISYQPVLEAECVVPNITVEVPNAPAQDHSSTYAPYTEPPQVPVYEAEHAVVPPAIPAAPLESPQIVPSEIMAPSSVEGPPGTGAPGVPGATGAPGAEAGPRAARARFVSERPAGAHKAPRHRDIPDSLDKVVVPYSGGGAGARGRSWRSPQWAARFHHPHPHPHQHQHQHPHQHHPYRRNYVHWNNSFQRQPYHQPRLRFNPPPVRPDMRPDMQPDMRPDMRSDIRQDMRSEMRPDIPHDRRTELRPDMRPEMRPDIHPDMRPDMRPEMRPDMRPEIRPDIRPDMRPEMRPDIHSDMRPDMRPDIHPDMRPDIHPDMRPAMRQDMRPDIRIDMRPEMRPDIRPDIRIDMRPDIRSDMRPEMRPDMRPDIRPDMRPDIRPELPMPPPQMGPGASPERALLPHESPRPPFNPNFPRFPPPQYRPGVEEPRPPAGPPFRAAFPYPRAPFGAPRFAAPIREIVPNSVNHMPQVTLRQPGAGGAGLPEPGEFLGGGAGGREPEVRMLPLQLPPSLPPGKKVLINPHFKGNFHPPPVEGLPTYIPTRIRKTPPLSPTLESKFGPIKDIDDAAERFIAEQRSALARAASRKFARRSPLRFIENTTIEIENELAGGGPGALGGLRGPDGAPGGPARRRSDDELSRRQEEFINANRAGLRRRMRSPSPPAPLSPAAPAPAAPAPASAPRSPERRARGREPADDDSEYRRRVREQESLRERVLRAKEVRRRRNAAALHTHAQDRDRERQPRDKQPTEPGQAERRPAAGGAREARRAPSPSPPPAPAPAPAPAPPPRASPGRSSEPDTTRNSAERESSPAEEAVVDTAEVNSTCENLTPPREKMPPQPAASPPRGLTPPLPAPAAAGGAGGGGGGAAGGADSDDDVDLILDDIDDILSDDDDTGRFKEKPNKVETVKAKPPTDLRARLPPRPAPASAPAAPAPTRRAHRQKIVFDEKEREREKEKEDRRKRDRSPARRPLVSSSTKGEDADGGGPPKKAKQTKQKADTSSAKQRQRIIFDKEQSEKQKETETAKDKTKQQSFSNRRVVLQRKVTQQPAKDARPDPSKPHAGIFSRAVRTAIGAADRAVGAADRAVGAADRARRTPEPHVEYGTDSDEERLLGEPAPAGNVAGVANLPHGMTDTRLRTLAGGEVQSLILDKEERTAKITFKTTVAAEGFKRKFHHKMVAASRLTVTLQ